MVRGPPSARGLHSDQQVPGQAVRSPAGEDALGEQVTLKHSDCQGMAWDMQLSSMNVVLGSPAELGGAELSPCLLASFIFPAENPQPGKKNVCEDFIVQKLNHGLCLHMFIATKQK